MKKQFSIPVITWTAFASEENVLNLLSTNLVKMFVEGDEQITIDHAVDTQSWNDLFAEN